VSCADPSLLDISVLDVWFRRGTAGSVPSADPRFYGCSFCDWLGAFGVCVAWQWGKVRRERRLACRLVQHYSILWFRLDLGPVLSALSPLPRPRSRFFCSVNLPLVARNHVSQKPEVSFNLGPIPPRTGHEHSYHRIPLSIRLQVSPDLRPLNRRDYSRVHS